METEEQKRFRRRRRSAIKQALERYPKLGYLEIMKEASIILKKNKEKYNQNEEETDRRRKAGEQ